MVKNIYDLNLKYQTSLKSFVCVCVVNSQSFFVVKKDFKCLYFVFIFQKINKLGNTALWL